MHLNVFGVFYLQFPNQHLPAAIAAIFRVILSQEYEVTNVVSVSFSLHNYLKIIIIFKLIII